MEKMATVHLNLVLRKWSCQETPESSSQGSQKKIYILHREYKHAIRNFLSDLLFPQFPSWDGVNVSAVAINLPPVTGKLHLHIHLFKWDRVSTSFPSKSLNIVESLIKGDCFPEMEQPKLLPHLPPRGYLVSSGGIQNHPVRQSQRGLKFHSDFPVLWVYSR